MKLCVYYGCGEPVEDNNLPGFQFCLYHQAHLQEQMQYDINNDCEYVNSIAYILSSFNAKAYKNSILVV